MKKVLVLMLLVASLIGNDDFAEFDSELETKKISDPFSGYNRMMTNFNDSLYMNVLKPVDKVYKAVTYIEVRRSVDKFFKNLYFPMRFVNNILQGKFTNAGEEAGRFIINTTVGIGGLFDPAKSELNLVPHNEDFGQTLGFYGVGAGPHIVLPLWGPSNLRDVVGIFPDTAVSFVDYNERSWWTLTDTWAGFLGVKTLEQINKYSLYSTQYDHIREDAVDLYPYLRDLYEQKRDKEIEK